MPSTAYLKKYVLSAALLMLPWYQVFAEKLDTVTLQLNWKHQFEFAAFYAAQNQLAMPVPPYSV
jgi:hypothetical protein